MTKKPGSNVGGVVSSGVSNQRTCADQSDGREPLEGLYRRVCQGLSAGEFQLAYQGIYQARSKALIGVEALIRWVHPEFGLLLPGAFLQTLDHPQVAADMTFFVVDSACRDLSRFMSDGHAPFPIAVNVPPSLLASETFASEIAAIARSHGVAPSLLELELSESEDTTTLLSTEILTRTLRSMGVRISIDDFGTGFSSLAMLSGFEVDTVKIAREMLASVPENPRACTVMSRILGMLVELDVTVVVEGVETEAQAQWLSQWPNVLAQGFFYSRPAFGLASVRGCPRPELQLVSGWS